MMLSDVCLSLSRTSGLSREQRGQEDQNWHRGSPRHSDSRHHFQGQRWRSPGRFTHRRVNASGSCSGKRGNVLAVGTYCYIAVCRAQARSARRREVLRRPQREERGEAYCGSRPAYRLFDLPVNFLHVICDLVKNLVIIHNCSILGRVAQTKTIVSYFIIHWCLTATSAQTGFIVAYEYEM